MLTVIFSLVIYFVGYIIVSNWRKEVKTNIKTGVKKIETYYEGHCWNCGKNEKIDSRYNDKCQKCNKYYLCNNCNMCLCDRSKLYNKKKKKSEWVETSRKKRNSNSKYGYCNNCNKILSGNRSKPLCHECWSSSRKKSNSNSKYGYCNNCNKRLRGDRSKPLCHECWSSSNKKNKVCR
jgi:hypothetical protein